MSEVNPFFQREAANEAPPSGPSSQRPARERTVPIPETLTPVPGYPQKLAVFKMAASRYWQVRCWMAGRTYRRSTQTQSLRMAQSFARQFYEQLMAQRYTEVSGQGPLFSPAAGPKRAAGQAPEPAPAAACPSFGGHWPARCSPMSRRAQRGVSIRWAATRCCATGWTPTSCRAGVTCRPTRATCRHCWSSRTF